jgi:hypothetical protein
MTTQQIQEGDTIAISVTGEVIEAFDNGFLVRVPHARKSIAIRPDKVLSLVEKRPTRKKREPAEKHFGYAASTLIGRLEYDVAKDREIIRLFLEEFAEYITWHTIPAAGSTIRQYKGLTIAQIAKILPDMEIEP